MTDATIRDEILAHCDTLGIDARLDNGRLDVEKLLLYLLLGSGMTDADEARREALVKEKSAPTGTMVTEGEVPEFLKHDELRAGNAHRER